MPCVHLITPAQARDNNGNWQTARRWQSYLSPQHVVRVATSLDAVAAIHPAMKNLQGAGDQVMIALHARRSAPSLEAFARAGGPVALVLTGTDLYRDIHSDASAQRSLELARILVVLHEQGIADLPAALRHKARVIFQSARSLKAMPLRRPRRHFDVAMVGHLRAEKDPMTAVRAMARLTGQATGSRTTPESGAIAAPARLLQVGGVRDEDIGKAFEKATAMSGNIVNLGPRPHAQTRQLIRKAQALVLPSLMEGGANVLIEAVCSAVPVLASRISGSVGMLGADYEGFFEVGNDMALAALIRRCQSDAGFHLRLQQQCLSRAPLFAVARERDDVRALVSDLVAR